MPENEGRDFISPQDKAAVFELIRPELAEMTAAITRMEEKVGKEESAAHTTALMFSVINLFDSFHGVLCGVAGWAEITPEEKRLRGEHAIVHSTSYANRVFVESNQHDFVLARLMEDILRNVNTERYEILDAVELRRRSKDVP